MASIRLPAANLSSFIYIVCIPSLLSGWARLFLFFLNKGEPVEWIPTERTKLTIILLFLFVCIVKAKLIAFLFSVSSLLFSEYSIAMSLKYPWHGNKIAPCYRDRSRVLTCRHTFLWAYPPTGGEELTPNSVSAWRVVHWEYSKAVGDYITRTGTCRDKSVFSHGLWVLMPNKSLQNSSSQNINFFMMTGWRS